MTTFSTPLDFQQVASVIKSQLKAINIDVKIVAQEPGTFAANNGTGNFEWDLTARGMRGDVDGYLGEFNPSNAIYQRVVPALQERQGVAGDRQRPDHARPGQAPADLQGRTDPAPERPPADPARRRSRSTRSCASACRACTSRSTTSTRAPQQRVAELVRHGLVARPGGARSAPLPQVRQTGSAWADTSSSGSSYTIPTLIGISIVIFLMVRLLPGDIIDVLARWRRRLAIRS